MKAEAKKGSILGLEAVEITGSEKTHDHLTRVNLQLRPGSLCLVRPGRSLESDLLLDACCGLHPIRGGRVLFLGRSWELLKPEAASDLRGLIGRIFGEERWIEHLSLADNLMLGQRQHSSLSQSRILQECHERSLFFGLPGIPMGRPAESMALDLFRAGCVRAFMGKPYLVLIEELPSNALSAVFPGLINGIREVRSRGGAVLWVTRARSVWEEASLDPDLRMVIEWNELKKVG